MAENPRRQRLLDVLDLKEDRIASDYLSHPNAAADREGDLRKVLRPHWEDKFAGFGKREIDLRGRFDEAFERLRLFELASEVGYLPEEESREEASQGLAGFFQSPAVARYVDAYFGFGVRFAAGRFAKQLGRPAGDLNLRPLWLP